MTIDWIVVGLTLDALGAFSPLAISVDAPPERDRLDDPRTVAEHSLDALVASSTVHWPTPAPPGTWG